MLLNIFPTVPILSLLKSSLKSYRQKKKTAHLSWIDFSIEFCKILDKDLIRSCVQSLYRSVGLLLTLFSINYQVMETMLGKMLRIIWLPWQPLISENPRIWLSNQMHLNKVSRRQLLKNNYSCQLLSIQ